MKGWVIKKRYELDERKDEGREKEREGKWRRFKNCESYKEEKEKYR